MHKFDLNILGEVKELLTEKRNILITTHYNPDGDAVGSSLALYHYLKEKMHNVSILIPNDIPQFLQWMPGFNEAVIYYHHSKLGDTLISQADIIFCLDYNAISRVNLFQKQLESANAKKILIDHHPEPVNQFDYMFSVIPVSSTAELIYHFISALGDNTLINTDIGINLYVGMMTDTGSFSYASNYPDTLETVADLIRKGVDTEKIHRLVYDTYSENRMRLLGYCLSEKLIVIPEYCTAYISLTGEDLEKFSFQPGDTEGVVNYALSIKNVSFAALFTQKKSCIRISFRSKADFSVNEFARKHYGGGGHLNAAGGDSYQPMAETLEAFEQLLPQYKIALQDAARKSSVL
ncbi:MAG TPA: bifunctional oligoribonuclease/PAP phosphatase NrnA [Lentimicrobium sp.]|nr:bifunctional oligoribonuclease/PAP phosphatase NrnA [Lentimicrobium sp.]